MSLFFEFFTQTVAAFFATVAFGILFSAPIKQYLPCGICGAVSWLVYYAFAESAGVVYATFLATVAIVLLSRFMAILRKCPVTVFLVCGIIPLVPGSAIYYTAYHFFMDNMSMAAHYGLLTFKLASAIVLGMIVIFAIPMPQLHRPHAK